MMKSAFLAMQGQELPVMVLLFHGRTSAGGLTPKRSIGHGRPKQLREAALKNMG